jgi:hypothetical protein
VRAADGYVAFLADVAAVGPTPQRLAAIYDVVLPALAQRQQHYLQQTDRLVDAPTVRILERYLTDNTRMIDASQTLRKELPELQLADRKWATNLSAREATLEPLAAPVAVGT